MISPTCRHLGGRPVQVAIAVDASRFEAFLAERLIQPVLPAYRTHR
jgi:hypothetical protein